MEQSERAAHRRPTIQTVGPILLIVLLALIFLIGSYEKTDSYYDLADNGKIYLVDTKNWGKKEIYRSEVRYNYSERQWEIDINGAGEWYGLYDLGDPHDNDSY